MHYLRSLFFPIAAFLIGVTLLTPLPTLAQTSAQESGCRCSGEVKTGNAKLGFTGTARTITNQCVARQKNDQKIFTQADCSEVARTYFIENNNTEFSFVTCNLDYSCSSPETPKTEFKIRKPLLNILIPNLSFSDIVTTTDENGNIQIPWIGEYIVAIYQLLINVASILGVILIIREGVRITLSAGGDDKVEGYHNIGRILIGLVLAWFSYIILYNLNSSLVSIRPFSIRVVTNNLQDLTPDEGEPETTQERSKSTFEKAKTRTNKVTGIGFIPCTEWKSGKDSNFSCDRWNARQITECGVTPKDSGLLSDPFDSCPDFKNPKESIPIYNTGHSRKSVVVLANMKDAICRAMNIAKEKGYELRINSAWRSFEEQANNWCKEKAHTGGRAAPGYSNHGHGAAIDVFLFKDGKQLTAYGYSNGNQCNTDPQYVRILGEIFYNADPRFIRLRKEIWHFEYDQDPDPARGIYYKFPYECKNREHD